MSTATTWEVIGYIDATLPGAKIVKPVLRDPSNPDVYFFADRPDLDIRSQIEENSVKVETGQVVGGARFQLLDVPVKFYERNLYIRQFSQNGLVPVTVFLDDVAEFERTKNALGK